MPGPAALLGVLPVNGGSSHMAIVGYLLPAAATHLRLPPIAPAENGAGLAMLDRDGIVVDAAQRRVLVSGRDAGLVFKEYELLAFLAANPDEVFTRAHLLSSVWGEQYDGTTRTVDVHVHRLRRKLGPEHARGLVTVRRVGYLYRPPAPGSQVAANR
jgi:DNA-binding response OmpR family regulator